MDLSIIIVNYNTLHVTAACIERIFSTTQGVDFEVILVDNASTDGSREYFSSDSRITYIYNHENLGFGRANNVGLNRAQGRNVMFLNPDTLFINNAATMLSRYLDAHHTVAVVGGNLYDEQMQPALSFRRQCPSLRWEINNLLGHLPEKIFLPRRWFFNFTHLPLNVGYITGADMMARRRDLLNAGGFADDFFMYYEDTDLCHRMAAYGDITSLPEACIQHLEGGSFEQRHIPRRRIMLSEQGRDRYYRRNFSPSYHIAANAIYIAALTLHSLIFRLTKRPLRHRICRLRRRVVLHQQRQLIGHRRC